MSNNRSRATVPEIDATAISEFCQAIEELVSRRKRPEEFEGLIDEAKTLANEWKDPRSAKHPKDRRPLFDGTSTPTNFLLAALVVALRRDHERVKQIRRYLPNRFEALCEESEWAWLRKIAACWPESALKRTRKFELKRRARRRDFLNSIEYQFGGGAEAELRQPLSCLAGLSLDNIKLQKPSALAGLPYQPTCLDNIFAGKAVNMQKLVDLFGMDRHRLYDALQGVHKRTYNYLDVVKMMNFLLSEKPRKKRKRRGRSPRKPWLNDREKRIRMLTGIVERMDSLSVSQDVWDAFTALVCYHLMKGRLQREDINQWLAPLVRRYLLDSGKK